MYRATTPTHTFSLPIDTNTCDEILVTYKQGKIEINKHYQDNTLPDGMTLDGEKVIVKLTQEEANRFKADSKASVQVRVLIGGDAFASKKFNVAIGDVLNDEVLA